MELEWRQIGIHVDPEGFVIYKLYAFGHGVGIGKHKYEKDIMAIMTGPCSFLKVDFLMALPVVTILLISCSMTHTNQIEKNISDSGFTCMNVTGIVLGEIKDNKTVALYYAEGFDYESIGQKINEGSPERVAKTNANQSFSFSLPAGGQVAPEHSCIFKRLFLRIPDSY